MKRFIKVLIYLILWSSCNQPVEIVRHAPVIHSIILSRTIIYPNEFIDVKADVSDEDKGDQLSYLWESTCGHFNNIHNNPTQWQAPDYPDTCTITLTVNDGYFEVSRSISITVIKK